MAASSAETRGPKMKLVVATDFSHKSELALDFALLYSRSGDAEVFLFHVVESKENNFRELDRLNVEYMERMKQAVLQAIDRLSARGIAHSVDTVNRRISHGKPGLEILRIAAGVSADMIFMGTPSVKGFKDLLAHAPCTLVLVRDKDPEFIAP